MNSEADCAHVGKLRCYIYAWREHLTWPYPGLRGPTVTVFNTFAKFVFYSTYTL